MQREAELQRHESEQETDGKKAIIQKDAKAPLLLY